MSIISLEGPQGCGKSVTGVAISHRELAKGKRIISNNHLNFPYVHFDPQYFLEHLQDEELADCLLFLDEAYLYLDSRSSSQKLNKLFTYFIVQTRKRGVDLIICTHHIDIVDKRLRRAVDIRGTCRSRGEDPCAKCDGKGEVAHGICPECLGFKSLNGAECGACGGTGLGPMCPRCLGYGKTGWTTTRFLDLRRGRRFKAKLFGPYYWRMYDTYERIPFMSKQMKIPVEDIM